VIIVQHHRGPEAKSLTLARQHGLHRSGRHRLIAQPQKRPPPDAIPRNACGVTF
jgi:hypothetical protein